MDEDAAATAAAAAAAGGSEGSTSSTSSTCQLAPSKAIAVSSTQSTMSVLTQEQVEAALHPSLKAAEIKVTEAMQQFVQDIESRISASLKQAAGDVTAHLGKEAAARVLAAERKVAFLEQELMNGKEQALSMLLRLKHATDAQTFDLQKQLSVQRTRAEEAEAKVTTLQDLVKRLKAQCKKTLGRTQRLSNPAGTLQEEVPENRGRVPTDSLSLIAGVACDVIGQQPESTFFYHDVGPSGTECSSPSEGRSKKPREEASNGAVELESSCAQNASIMDTHNSDAMAMDRNPEALRFDATAHSDEQQLNVGCASVDVRDRTSLEMTSRQHSAHDDALSSDTGDDVSNEASGVSSLAAPDLGAEHSPTENQRRKRRNRRVSSSEKLSRLMVGCKRSRGMKASTKVSTGGEHTDTKRSVNVVVESCRDSRRLMQGARQLFSLAERKW